MGSPPDRPEERHHRSRSGSPRRERDRERERKKPRSGGFAWKDKEKDKGKTRERERDRDSERDRDRGHRDRDRRDGERDGYRERDRSRDRHRHRDRSRDRDRDRDRERDQPRSSHRRDRARSPNDPGNIHPSRRPAASGTRRPAAPPAEMIIVHINDRLGTKAAIPCLASDLIRDFKVLVAAQIGRSPHEILLKRQGERPFKDVLSLEDYGISNGAQIDLEVDTGD